MPLSPAPIANHRAAMLSPPCLPLLLAAAAGAAPSAPTPPPPTLSPPVPLHNMTLKQRVRAGYPLRAHRAPTNATRGDVENIIRTAPNDFDLFFLDVQHHAFVEREIQDFSKFAEEFGKGIMMRMTHKELAFLAGHYADLGITCLKIPQVRVPDHVKTAIRWWYYPHDTVSEGRSWGGVGYGIKNFHGPSKRVDYAKWWNSNGLIVLQLESVEGLEKAREIGSLEGVDAIMFGPNDMTFTLEGHSGNPWKTWQDGAAYASEQLKGIKTVYSGCSIVPGGKTLAGQTQQLQEYNTDVAGDDVC